MNDKDHAVYEALLRVNRSGADHSSAFDPGTQASDATAAKNSLLEKVWEDLQAIAATARSIAKKQPGFDVNFRLADNTQREIVSTGEAFLEHLQDPATVANFTAYSIPSGFVADLEEDLITISGRKGDQTDDRTGDAGETALTRTQIRQARDLIASLDTSVRNKFRTDPEVLAEWSTASRIHRTGRRRNEDETPPLEPPTA